MSSKAANYADFQRKVAASSWRRRLSFSAILWLAGASFIVGYPLYVWISDALSSGIHARGDLLAVDMKAMSSFEMDQAHGTDSQIPQCYRDLNGKRVQLVGQMWDPYAAGGKIRNFTLVYSINNCCFSGPPKVQHLVQATVEPGREVKYFDDYVRVVGTLHVGVVRAGGRVQSVYRLDVEKLSRD